MKIIIASYLFFLTITIFGQIPEFNWVKSSSTTEDFSYGRVVTYDQDNNSIFAAEFSASIMFDGVSFDANDPNPTSFPAGADMLLIKTDPLGEVLWTLQMGGNDKPYGDDVFAIATNEQNEIFLSGRFRGENVLANGMPLENIFWYFMMKISPDGEILWSKQVPFEITQIIPQNDQIFFSANYNNTVEFDGISLTGGSRNIAVGALDETGNLVWVNTAGGDGYNDFTYALDLAIDSENNVYVLGSFDPSGSDVTCYLGELTFDVPNGGIYGQGFIAKLNSQGIFEWVESHLERVRWMEINEDDRIYLTGTFGNSMDNNWITLSEDNFTRKVYLMECDTDGNFVWLKHYEAENEMIPSDLQLDSEGSLYLSATINGQISIEGNPLSATNSQNFIGKFDTDGTFISHTKIPTTVWGANLKIAVNSDHNVLMTGRLDELTVLGDFVLEGITNGSNFFIASMVGGMINPIDTTTTPSDTTTTPSDTIVNYLNSVNNSTGIIQLVPNPVKDICTLYSLIEDNIIISIYSVDGQKITTFQSSQRTIDLSNLKQGVYLVKFDIEGSQNQVYYQKLVKE